MGIPRFARWLTQRYPFIVCPAAQHPKPQFDHFYIDLNGIIHHSAYRVQTTGSSSRFLSRGEKETAATVFAYIDLIVSIVGPTRTVFVAIDGPAPRAKINQQRQRRFRVERLRKLKKDPTSTTDAPAGEQTFDPNSITPGTEFMARVAEHIQFFLRKKVEEDRLWRRLRVVFSGPDVPGEGEHKIAQFVRKSVREGAMALHEAHCIYGLDADLIMLGLVTHLPYVAILREKVVFKKKNKFDSLAAAAADAAASPTTEGDPAAASATTAAAPTSVADDDSGNARMEIELQSTDEFQYIHLCLLREALELEFCHSTSPGPAAAAGSPSLPHEAPHGHLRGHQGAAANGPPQRDVNKVIDDLVFLCYLIGNDFIPEVPGLGIDNDGLKQIFESYKEFLLEGNLLHHKVHVVDVDTSRPQDVRVNAQLLERVLDKIENRIVADVDKKAAATKEKESTATSAAAAPAAVSPSTIESALKQMLRIGGGASAPVANEPAASTKPAEPVASSQKPEEPKVPAPAAEASTKPTAAPAPETAPATDQPAPSAASAPSPAAAPSGPASTTAASAPAVAAAPALSPYDAYRKQYYTNRFPELGFSSAEPFDPLSVEHAQRLHQMARSYFEGILWTFYYYYRDTVPSWGWGYPHYFAPMVRDIAASLKLRVVSSKKSEGSSSVDLFDPSYFAATQGEPYHPFEQLLGVLPPSSAQGLLPASIAQLAETASLKQYFPEPEGYQIYEDEKGRDWRSIALIPFIDMAAITKVVRESISASPLSPSDALRNSFGHPKLIYHDESAEPVTVQSTLPDLTGPLVNCRALVKDMTSDSASALPISAATAAASAGPYGFPSTQTLKCSWKIEDRGRFHLVIEHNETAETLITTAATGSTHTEQQANSLAELLIGKEIFVGYPYGIEARVVAISTPSYLFRRSRRGKVVADEASGSRVHADRWRSAMGVLNHSLAERGLQVAIKAPANHPKGMWDVVVHAAPLSFYAWHKTPSSSPRQAVVSIVGKHFDEDAAEAAVSLGGGGGQHEKRNNSGGRKGGKSEDGWSGFAFPLATVLTRHPQRDLPFPNRPSHATAGTRVIYLGGSGGCYATVAEVNAVTLSASSPPSYSITIPSGAPLLKEPFVGRQAVSATTGSDKYLPNGAVCRDLKISGLALTRLAGTLPLHIKPKGTGVAPADPVTEKQAEGLLDSSDNKANEGSTVDIGLGMKYSGRNLQVPGYARKKPSYEGGGGWEYSERAVSLIKDYFQRFPELFAAIEEDPQADSYDAQEVFSIKSRDQWQTRVRELVTWLDSPDVRLIRHLPLVSCEVESLMDTTIKRIEAEAGKFSEELRRRRAAAAPKPIVLRDVPQVHVVDPTSLVLLLPVKVALSNDANSPTLGDRVVYLWDTGAVPFGVRGTVVTIDRAAQRADVVFDDEWLEGSTLNGRLSSLRGASVPLYSLQRVTAEALASVSTASSSLSNSGSASPGSPAGRGRGRGAKGSPKVPQAQSSHVSRNAFDMLADEEN